MKIVIQRVLNCSVSVNGELISSIRNGLFVLVGISRSDTKKDMDYMVRKVLNMKLFGDEDKRWSKSVMDKDFEVLCVSQFTLCHKLKGNKLDFHDAMKGEESNGFYNDFIDELRLKYKPEKIKDGVFGAHMIINICNDGPVTVELNSKKEQENTSEDV